MISGNYGPTLAQPSFKTQTNYTTNPQQPYYTVSNENQKLKVDQRYSNFYILAMASISVVGGILALLAKKRIRIN